MNQYEYIIKKNCRYTKINKQTNLKKKSNKCLIRVFVNFAHGFLQESLKCIKKNHAKNNT